MASRGTKSDVRLKFRFRFDLDTMRIPHRNVHLHSIQPNEIRNSVFRWRAQISHFDYFLAPTSNKVSSTSISVMRSQCWYAHCTLKHILYTMRVSSLFFFFGKSSVVFRTNPPVWYSFPFDGTIHFNISRISDLCKHELGYCVRLLWSELTFTMRSWLYQINVFLLPTQRGAIFHGKWHVERVTGRKSAISLFA